MGRQPSFPPNRGREPERHRPPRHPGRTRAQPQERPPGPAPQRVDRVHGPVRVGQVFACLRHHLRRGPAPLCRVAVGLRPPVPRPDGEARRRLHRGPVPGHLDRPEVHLQEPPLHRRHHHRGLRLPAAAVRPHRPAPLPGVRPADRPPDPRPDRRPDPRAARGHPLPAAGPGGAGPQGRVRGAAAQLLGQGVRQGQGRRRGPRPVRADPAGQDLQARHRDRGRPPGRPRPRGRREGPPPPGRLGRDGRRPVRGAGRGRAGRRGPRAPVLDPPGLPVRQPVVRGAGPAQLLLQRPLRGLPGLHRPGGQAGGRPRAGRPQPQPARDRRGHPALAGHPRVQRVLRPAAGRGGRGGRVRPRHPLGAS